MFNWNNSDNSNPWDNSNSNSWNNSNLWDSWNSNNKKNESNNNENKWDTWLNFDKPKEPENTGTRGNQFTPFTQTVNGTEFNFQNICVSDKFNNFSQDELRLKDQENNNNNFSFNFQNTNTNTTPITNWFNSNQEEKKDKKDNNNNDWFNSFTFMDEKKKEESGGFIFGDNKKEENSFNFNFNSEPNNFFNFQSNEPQKEVGFTYEPQKEVGFTYNFEEPTTQNNWFKPNIETQPKIPPNDMNDCICGNLLSKNIVENVYLSNKTIWCDICNQNLLPNNTVYHCYKDNVLHSNGYDLCEKCIIKKVERPKPQPKNNVNFVTTNIPERFNNPYLLDISYGLDVLDKIEKYEFSYDQYLENLNKGLY